MIKNYIDTGIHNKFPKTLKWKLITTAILSQLYLNNTDVYSLLHCIQDRHGYLN